MGQSVLTWVPWPERAEPVLSPPGQCPTHHLCPQASKRAEFLIKNNFPTKSSLTPPPSPQPEISSPSAEHWRRQWHPTPVLLPGKSHGQRSLVGCSPWGQEESDTTERLHFLFSLSCTGEGNGNPLQCSCLENPRDGGAWWVAIYGVAQSRTRLKRLSSSSSSSVQIDLGLGIG